MRLTLLHLFLHLKNYHVILHQPLVDSTRSSIRMTVLQNLSILLSLVSRIFPRTFSGVNQKDYLTCIIVYPSLVETYCGTMAPLHPLLSSYSCYVAATELNISSIAFE